MDDFLNSKYALVSGGLSFFCLSFLAGWWVGNDISTTFSHATIASVIGAFVGKVFNSILIANVRDAMREKREAEEADQSQKN